VLQTAYTGVSANGPGFVSKLSADGSKLIFSTYLGGTNYTTVNGVALDQAANVYLTGSESGGDGFPVTPGAFQTQTTGPTPCFVSKMSPDGKSLLYSTLLGSRTTGSAIAVDANGNAYVGGATSDSTFPVIAGAFQPKFQGHTHCSGGSACIGVFPSSNAFVTKLNANGTALIYSTYIGGSGNVGGGDGIRALAVDSSGNAFIAGAAHSADFPLLNPISQGYDCNFCISLLAPSEAFVSVLDASGSALWFSTLLGGPGDDYVSSLSLDASGIWVAGLTGGDFPVMEGGYQTGRVIPGEPGQLGDANRAFVARLGPALAATPVPTVTSIIAAAVLAGQANVQLTVFGNGFTSGDRVEVEQVLRPTNFFNSGRLTAAADPSDFSSAPYHSRTIVRVQRRTQEGFIAVISMAGRLLS